MYIFMRLAPILIRLDTFFVNIHFEYIEELFLKTNRLSHVRRQACGVTNSFVRVRNAGNRWTQQQTVIKAFIDHQFPTLLLWRPTLPLYWPVETLLAPSDDISLSLECGVCLSPSSFLCGICAFMGSPYPKTTHTPNMPSSVITKQGHKRAIDNNHDFNLFFEKNVE